MLHDFLGCGLDHAATDGSDDAADLGFAVVMKLGLSGSVVRAVRILAKGDGSLPFHKARSAAAFDGHAKGFGRMLVGELDSAFEFTGERGYAHFERDFVAARAVGSELLRAWKAFREEGRIREGLPDFFARSGKKRGTLQFHLCLPLDFEAEDLPDDFTVEDFGPADFASVGFAADV